MTVKALSAISILLFLILFAQVKNTSNIFDENKKFKFQVDSLSKVNDSLKSELFVQQINVMRYEHIIDLLKEESPECGKKIDEAFSQTE